MRSLKTRFIIASLLWTGGLLFVSHVSSFWFFGHFGRIRVTHTGVFVTIAVIAMAVGFLGVRRGLSPFAQLRERLALVREGRAARLDGTYPAEVQPLVNDLNALLDDKERSVKRAVAKAGDLAHGLKTPLAVLAQEAERTESAILAQQVERMRRQIDYHLAHARAAASGATPGAHCELLPSAEGLSRTLLRLHAERGLSIDVRVAPEHFFRGQREDLDEMLGNLLDNACKWARSRVVIESAQREGIVLITVDDDGPGIDPALRQAVLQRGVRADEAAPGSGFGLAIVRDLAEVYGGSIALGSAPLGGVRARLELPA